MESYENENANNEGKVSLLPLLIYPNAVEDTVPKLSKKIYHVY